MSLLMTASITTSFVLPLAQTTGLHIFFVGEFDFNNLDSGENLQEHKARARGNGPCE